MPKPPSPNTPQLADCAHSLEGLLTDNDNLKAERDKLAAQVEELKEELAAAGRDEKLQFAGYERLETTNDALRKELAELANEASGFLSLAWEQPGPGFTNCKVLERKIKSARKLLGLAN